VSEHKFRLGIKKKKRKKEFKTTIR
jgi:hypothetical protein